MLIAALLRLDGMDLLANERQACQLAIDLVLQVRRRAGFLLAPPSVPGAAGNAAAAQVVQHQQRADAVGVLSLLVAQALELAAGTAGVFLLGRGLMQHSPDLGLPVVVAHEQLEQLVAIDAIGFGAPAPARDLDAGGIDHDVVNAVLAQPAMQPPAVTAGLVAGVERRRGRNAKAHTGLGGAAQESLGVACGNGEAAGRATVIAEGQLPALVGQLEAHVQRGFVKGMLGSEGLLGHVLAPTSIQGMPVVHSTGARVKPSRNRPWRRHCGGVKVQRAALTPQGLDLDADAMLQRCRERRMRRLCRIRRSRLAAGLRSGALRRRPSIASLWVGKERATPPTPPVAAPFLAEAPSP